MGSYAVIASLPVALNLLCLLTATNAACEEALSRSVWDAGD